MVTTGNGDTFDGPVNVFVDSGSGYVLISTPGLYRYVKGEIVIDQCFHTIVGVQVSNQDNDGWVGSFELSTDGKATYLPLICSDCNGSGTTNTMPIYVDGDGYMASAITTRCFLGSKCTLTVRILQILDIQPAFCIDIILFCLL